jgi:hypothetical protein
MSCETDELGPSPRHIRGNQAGFSHENPSQGAIAARTSLQAGADRFVKTHEAQDADDPDSARKAALSPTPTHLITIINAITYQPWPNCKNWEPSWQPLRSSQAAMRFWLINFLKQLKLKMEIHIA